MNETGLKSTQPPVNVRVNSFRREMNEIVGFAARRHRDRHGTRRGYEFIAVVVVGWALPTSRTVGSAQPTVRKGDRTRSAFLLCGVRPVDTLLLRR